MQPTKKASQTTPIPHLYSQQKKLVIPRQYLIYAANKKASHTNTSSIQPTKKASHTTPIPHLYSQQKKLVIPRQYLIYAANKKS